jgi:hypothetical protein
MELKMAFHSVTGRRIVEVYDNRGVFVAAIYPDEETNGVNIVSKHFKAVTNEAYEPLLPEVRAPGIGVQFKRDFEEEPQDVYKRRTGREPRQQ